MITANENNEGRPVRYNQLNVAAYTHPRLSMPPQLRIQYDENHDNKDDNHGGNDHALFIHPENNAVRECCDKL